MFLSRAIPSTMRISSWLIGLILCRCSVRLSWSRCHWWLGTGDSSRRPSHESHVTSHHRHPTKPVRAAQTWQTRRSLVSDWRCRRPHPGGAVRRRGEGRCQMADSEVGPERRLHGFMRRPGSARAAGAVGAAARRRHSRSGGPATVRFRPWSLVPGSAPVGPGAKKYMRSRPRPRHGHGTGRTRFPCPGRHAADHVLVQRRAHVHVHVVAQRFDHAGDDANRRPAAATVVRPTGEKCSGRMPSTTCPPTCPASAPGQSIGDRELKNRCPATSTRPR